jgi:phosphoribosylaminoimidazole-succinocarboxamide synthase
LPTGSGLEEIAAELLQISTATPTVQTSLINQINALTLQINNIKKDEAKKAHLQVQ